MELRFAEFGRLVGGRLGPGVAGDWGRGGDCLEWWYGGSYGGGRGQVSG